jgi:hypothetical protein
MRRALALSFPLLLVLALSLFVALPADATVVYVTCTGTVIRGDDPDLLLREE